VLAVSRTLRSPPVLAAAGLVLLWVGLGTSLSFWFAGRVRDWAVMTDELQYAKLALAVAASGSPLPEIHDASMAATNQLYPLLLAPLYGSLSSPDAFRAAHVLNAVVMTSAVFPAYLLARALLPRLWSFAVALLAGVTPWIVLTGFVMSEAAAYPAFLWALLAFHRAVAEPSTRRDVLAVAGLGLAILARTQFAALAGVLLGATLLHELLSPHAPLRARARAAWERHRALWTAFVIGGALVGALALLRGGLLGAYSTTVEEGSVLPRGVWWSALEHLAVVGVGAGFLPLMLGAGWMLVSVRAPNEQARAFATISLLTVVGLALETASFDLRFGGPDIVRDRYLFYVVPLLLIGSAAALREAPRRAVVAGAVAVAAVFAAAAARAPYPTFPGLSVDTPVSILNETLIDQSGGLAVGTFVALVVAGVGVALGLALLVLPVRLLSIGAFGTVLLFSILVLRAEGERMLEGTALTGRPLAGPPGVVLDWVDRVVPEGETAALVPFPISTAWGVSAIQWWDVEFWNRSITRAYTAPDGNFTYTSFPLVELRVDRRTGLVAGTAEAPAYVVVAPGDPRLGLAGSVRAENAGLRVVDADRPYRALWSSRGLTTDGWTVPGRPASVRLYARPASRPEVLRATLSVRAPEGAAADYRLSTETANRSGTVAAGALTDEVVLVCVAPGSPVDVTIAPTTAATVAGPPLGPEPGPRRRVGVGLGAIDVESTGRGC
jgi:hypothetical protein